MVVKKCAAQGSESCQGVVEGGGVCIVEMYRHGGPSATLACCRDLLNPWDVAAHV